ncbi:MAG: methionine/alanine import family NSS transporter small subunit [Thermoanaerobacteraceae bacterium]|nr:methionine/alanine import family NSS transporter small subunit [Thermoanaerobacteraceae bacterium]
MSGSAIAMMIFAMVVLWGGSAYCISVAMRKQEQE